MFIRGANNTFLQSMNLRTRRSWTTFLIASIVAVLFYKTILSEYLCSIRPVKELDSYDSPDDFEHFSNQLGTPSGKYIVPNIVHFIRWNKKFTFIEAICLLAAVKNQKPDKVYIHTDKEINGKYWDMVMNEPNVKDLVELKHMDVPTEVFGQDLNPWWKYWHGGDVARIKVLMEHGGIFLDNDSFLVRNLNEFRKYEMTIGWQEGMYLANQGIVANKNARFLKKWLNSYRHHYWRWGWYYNTGERPTKTILQKQPHLIHRMKNLFCEDPVGKLLYLQRNDTWRNHYVIHLSIRWWIHLGNIGANLSSKATYPVEFNEKNIKDYNCSLLDMVQSVYSLKNRYNEQIHNF